MMGGMGENQLTPQPIQKGVKIGDFGGRRGWGGGGVLNLASLPMSRSPFQGCQRIFAQYILKRESSNCLIKSIA